MALDHALAAGLAGDRGVLRLYSWSPRTVSFGRNEPALGLYDRTAAEAEGIAFVRRPTGGRAVLHAEEITYAVTLPARALGGVRAAYLAIHRGLVAGLRALGVAADVALAGAPLRPDAGPCFQGPTAGEVVAAGRKLVGSAQVRFGGALLQHGSLILDGDQRALARLRGGGADPAPPATLRGLIGPVDAPAVARALADGLGLALGGEWSKGGYSPEQLETAYRFERERYGTEAWTWRR
ncbi:MAG TPA: biotin/lipoate A/B protein ligase family protein [Longimicrobiales bacterium]|nr:biotin/lipoate A/B protein ligase family protein [Longimicrobiales bacterium]